MNLRGSLFVKIFIGFWLITTAVLASWMFANQYFESRPGDALEQRRPGPPHRFVLRMIYDLQNADEAQVKTLVEQAYNEHEVEIFLIDRQDQDLLGRPVPADVLRVAEQLRGASRRAHLNTSTGHLLAFDIYRPEHGIVRTVFAFQPSPHHLLRLLGSNAWLRIGLAFLTSGLLCFALSRLMTNRLKALQRAARQLAMGDLDTRLEVRKGGGDETDELARDFNRMAGQLQERIQAQKRLLSDVSHELRSPLARLRIALALAQEQPAEASRHLQRIEQETERLEQLIGQLLASQAQGMVTDCHIDLVSLLEHLVSDVNFEGAAQNKQIELQQTVDHAVIASSGDLLHKSLENILRNAISHTASGTTVLVTLDQSPDAYRIRVQDQGGGVPEPELEKIFEEFYRTDTARTRDSGGYGLGLAIARRAILQHGGQIRADNSGSGLEVTISLPASSSAGTADEESFNDLPR